MKDKLIWKFRPAVDKKVLMFLAGAMWCGVGFMLLRYSVIWLTADKPGIMLIYGSLGIIASLPIYYYGFSRLAEKNLIRLMPLKEKRCAFSFITWKSYLIVPVMISLGLFLRNSSIEREHLSVIYTGIGLGLFLSGLHYFRFLLSLLFAGNDKQ